MSSEKQDPLKIAVLAYGSLILNLSSPYYDEPLKVATPFEKTSLEIWTSFQDLTAMDNEIESRVCLLALSSQNQLTRKTSLYHARHIEDELERAILNFMKREGMKDNGEIAIIQSAKRTDRSIFSELSFDSKKILEIEQWLEQQGYDVALIAQSHPRYEVHQIQTFIGSCSKAQNRTLSYFYRLPPDTQQAHRDALEFLGLQPKNLSFQ